METIMNISEYKEYLEYIEELELIQQQYNQEEAYYFIIDKLIRDCITTDDVCVRDVHNLNRLAQNFPGRNYLFPNKQAPDFVIMKKDFTEKDKDQDHKICGCVEIKNTYKSKYYDVCKHIKKWLGKEGENNNEIVCKINKNKKNCTYKIYPTENVSKKPVVAELAKELYGFKKVILTNGYQWIHLYGEGNGYERKCSKEIINLKNVSYEILCDITKDSAKDVSNIKKWNYLRKRLIELLVDWSHTTNNADTNPNSSSNE